MAKQDLTPLVIKAQRGSKSAMEDLISQCYQDIYYFAFKTVKNEDLASDITQESCMEIITTLDKLREPGAFSVWARRITYHQCTRHFRETHEFQPEENEDGETILDVLPDESVGSLPEEVCENKEFQKTMQDMLDSLPAEQRSALMLYYYEKLSVKQIADIHCTSEGTIKSRLNYGRKAIKGKVEEYEKKNGIKLHSIALLPLMYFLFGQGKIEAQAAAATVLPKVASASGMVLRSGAKKAASSVLTKVIAVILAATATTGVVIGGVTMLQNQDSAEVQDDDSTKSTGHTHSFDAEWIYDDASHWAVCTCGKELDPQAHTYEGRQCTVCSYQKASEGLNIYISTHNGTAVVNGIGTCTDTDIVIPATHEGYPVIQISDSAFRECEELISVTVPDSVTTIGRNAFYKCTQLTEVVLGQGVDSIDPYAFYGCTSLASINIPKSVTYIGGNAFENCSSLTDITVPGSVGFLNSGLFWGCTSLRNVVLEPGITEIVSFAFADCSSLVDIQFPEQLRKIGSAAFQNCTALTKVTLPNSVTNIDDWAFSGCTGLTEFTFPENMIHISSNVLYECANLTHITIPDGVETIGSSAFNGCTSLTSITIPNGVKNIKEYAFRNCSSLISIVIPDSVESIYHDAFSGCTSLTTVDMPADLSGAFGLDYSAFTGCTSLTAIVIPDQVTTLQDGVFHGCTSLTQVTIPASVTSIEDWAFCNCSALTDIYYLGTTAQWNAIKKADGMFTSWNQNAGNFTVHCTDGDI